MSAAITGAVQGCTSGTTIVDVTTNRVMLHTVFWMARRVRVFLVVGVRVVRTCTFLHTVTSGAWATDDIVDEAVSTSVAVGQIVTVATMVDVTNTTLPDVQVTPALPASWFTAALSRRETSSGGCVGMHSSVLLLVETMMVSIVCVVGNGVSVRTMVTGRAVNVCVSGALPTQSWVIVEALKFRSSVNIWVSVTASYEASQLALHRWIVVTRNVSVMTY